MRRNYHRGLFTNASIRLDKESFTYIKSRKSRSAFCTICNSHLCSDTGVPGRKSLKKSKGEREKRIKEILNDY